MEAKNDYYIVLNPVERTAPFEEKFTLVNVVGENISVVHGSLSNEKNFSLLDGELKIINTPLAPYYRIKKVNQDGFNSIRKLFN